MTAEPRKVTEFLPFRLLQAIEAQLAGISQAYGYNTNPSVFHEREAAEANETKYTLFIDATSDGTPNEQGVGSDEGPSMQPVFTVTIVGVAKYETEWPRELVMSLEQDVRTALHSMVPNLRTLVGRGASFRFGECIYDGGVLAPYKEAGFRLTVTYTWSQGRDW